MPYLLLALLAYPAAEIVTMILAAKAIGVGWLLGWIVLTGLAGALMLRHHRLAVGFSLFRDWRSGDVGVGSLFWLARYYIAAVFLLMPGLLGDVFALILLLPWGPRLSAGSNQGAQSGVIDGEYRRVDPGADPRLPPR
ncbi:FxsA family protein [Chitinibacteraceae bacterium HSL-7]